MNAQKTKVDWDKITLAAGLIGFVLETLSFIVEAGQGNATNIIVLRILGIIGIALWVAWVTVSIIRLQKGAVKGLSATTDSLEGYLTKAVYFDGTNRNFFNEVRFGRGGDAKGSDLEEVELAKVIPEGNKIRIQRLHNRFRWIMSVIKYQNTSKAPSDRYIPTDPDPSVQGQFVRFIYFEFKACVENKAHEIYVRLRNTKGGWLRKYGTSGERAARKVRVSQKTWEHFEGVVGPVRADEPCYISLDIMPGPKGANQSLLIKDLRILEVREED